MKKMIIKIIEENNGSIKRGQLHREINKRGFIASDILLDKYLDYLEADKKLKKKTKDEYFLDKN